MRNRCSGIKDSIGGIDGLHGIQFALVNMIVVGLSLLTVKVNFGLHGESVAGNGSIEHD